MNALARVFRTQSPEPEPVAVEPTSPADRIALKCARDKAQRIEVRLTELDDLIPRLPSGTARHAECLSERSHLHAYRRITANLIATLTTPAQDDPKHEALVAAFVRERATLRLRSIERAEREGDWREARLKREGLLDLMAEVRAEFNG